MLKINNFAQGTVSIGYDASATSIALTSGHGARFPATGPFRCVWWNKTDYPNPSNDPNREIIEVTSRSTDTLTVVRGQETSYGGLAASTKNTASKTYAIALVATAEQMRLAEHEIMLSGYSDLTRVSLSQLLLASVRPGINDCGLKISPSNAFTGSGNGGSANFQNYLSTGGTTGSTARRYIANNNPGWGPRNGGLNFDYKWAVGYRISMSGGFGGGNVNLGRVRMTLGKDQSTGIGDLTVKGIGFRMTGLTCYLQVHDGTTLTEVAFSRNPLNSNITSIVLLNLGGGNVSAYLAREGDADFTLVASTAAGPTGTRFGTYQTEIENTTATEDFTIYFRDPIIAML